MLKIVLDISFGKSIQNTLHCLCLRSCSKAAHFLLYFLLTALGQLQIFVALWNSMHILSCAITSCIWGLFTCVNQKGSVQSIYLGAAEKWQQLTSLMLGKKKWMYWVYEQMHLGQENRPFVYFPNQSMGLEQQTEAICEHNHSTHYWLLTDLNFNCRGMCVQRFRCQQSSPIKIIYLRYFQHLVLFIEASTSPLHIQVENFSGNFTHQVPSPLCKQLSSFNFQQLLSSLCVSLSYVLEMVWMVLIT